MGLLFFREDRESRLKVYPQYPKLAAKVTKYFGSESSYSKSRPKFYYKSEACLKTANHRSSPFSLADLKLLCKNEKATFPFLRWKYIPQRVGVKDGSTKYRPGRSGYISNKNLSICLCLTYLKLCITIVPYFKLKTGIKYIDIFGSNVTNWQRQPQGGAPAIDPLLSWISKYSTVILNEKKPPTLQCNNDSVLLRCYFWTFRLFTTS